jgi:hypothetical protein
MTRLEKCELLKLKGYTYDPENGKIYGTKGQEIVRKCNGYILFGNTRNWKHNTYGHHFAWYWVYGNVDFEMLDHINQNRSDNRISNLRIVTHQENCFNNNYKGYSWDKDRNKWKSQIHISGKTIHLGRYNTEQEARDAYLIAKEKYHTILYQI